MLNLSICLAYLTVMIGVGIYSAKRVKTLDGFFLANRKMGGLFVTGSLLATIMGGSNTIGMAGLGFKRGVSGSLWLLAGSFGMIVLAFFLAKKVKRFSLYTLPELLEKFYDKRVKLVASVLICFSWVAIVAGQIITAGAILNVLIPLSPPFFAIVFSLVVIAYTILGGQDSIIRTDFLQFLIIITGILSVFLIVLNRVGGVGEFMNRLPGEFFSFPVGIDFTGWDALSLTIMVGSAYLVGPDIYSRLFCAKNEKTARFSAFSAGVIIIPFAFLVTAIGMGARILFPQIQAEEAFPMIIQETLPPGVGGAVMASLLAALMSSADTCILTISTILTMDIYYPSFGRACTKKQILNFSRWMVVLVGLLSLFIALMIKEIIPALLLGYTVFCSGLAIPILAGFYRDKLGVNSTGAFAATIGGGGMALTGKLLGIKHCGLMGFIMSGLLLFVVSKMRRKS